jgi:hypothetical protein
VSNICRVESAGAVLSTAALVLWFVADPRLSLALVVNVFDPADSGLSAVSAAVWYA